MYWIYHTDPNWYFRLNVLYFTGSINEQLFILYFIILHLMENILACGAISPRWIKRILGALIDCNYW